jgi:Carboxypeptidase regulatory-like domain/TonB-dependent Receptor Plug Domain
MKMYKNWTMTTAVLAILMVCSLSGWAQLGKIHGVIKESYTVVPGAKVSLYEGENFTGQGVLTDADGKFEFALLNPGEYVVKIEWDGLTVMQTRSVAPGESQRLDLDLMAFQNDSHQDTVRIIGNAELFNTDRDVVVIDRRMLNQVAGPRNFSDIMASTTAGFVQKDQGDPMSFKGARESANATYFDGMKIRGSEQMPLGAIEQVSAMTGGIPAEYGDALGAVIVVTTRNPSMAMGHVGKPLTKSERQIEKQLRKKGTKAGALYQGSDGLVCN